MDTFLGWLITGVVLAALFCVALWFETWLNRRKEERKSTSITSLSFTDPDLPRPQSEIRNLYRHLPLREWCMVDPPQLQSTDIISLQRYTRLMASFFYLPTRKPGTTYVVGFADQQADVAGHVHYRKREVSGEVFIEIHPCFTHNPIAITYIVAHELSHIVLDAYGVPGNGSDEEHLVEVLTAWVGYAPIMLDFKSNDNGCTLGYLTPSELAVLLQLRRKIQPFARPSRQHSIVHTASEYLRGYTSTRPAPQRGIAICEVCGQWNRTQVTADTSRRTAMCGLCGSKLKRISKTTV